MHLCISLDVCVCVSLFSFCKFSIVVPILSVVLYSWPSRASWPVRHVAAVHRRSVRLSRCFAPLSYCVQLTITHLMTLFEHMFDVFKLLLTRTFFFFFFLFLRSRAPRIKYVRELLLLLLYLYRSTYCYTSTAAAGSAVPIELYHIPPWSSRALSRVSHALAFELHHRTVRLSRYVCSLVFFCSCLAFPPRFLSAAAPTVVRTGVLLCSTPQHLLYNTRTRIAAVHTYEHLRVLLLLLLYLCLAVERHRRSARLMSRCFGLFPYLLSVFYFCFCFCFLLLVPEPS